VGGPVETTERPRAIARGLLSITGQAKGGARGSGRLYASSASGTSGAHSAVVTMPFSVGSGGAHAKATSTGSLDCLKSGVRSIFAADVRIAGDSTPCTAARLARAGWRETPESRECADTETSRSDKTKVQAKEALPCCAQFSDCRVMSPFLHSGHRSATLNPSSSRCQS